MKIILFRFEKDTLYFLECDIDSGNLSIGIKEKLSLDSEKSRGEKYKMILDELRKIQIKFSPYSFAYQSPQKYRGAIKDEEGFASAAILHLFCSQNDFNLLELTPPIVREKLSIPNKDFKALVEKEKINVCKDFSIAKSDKLMDGLLYLWLLKSYL
jgi:hypothetical protein